MTPTRWAYEANLLQEARRRSATFTNQLERKLRDCENAAGACQASAGQSAGRGQPAPAAAPTVVRTETDVALFAFPVNERTGLAQSFQVLGTFFGVFVLLTLASLGMKVQR
jgi:hypothetical protein